MEYITERISKAGVPFRVIKVENTPQEEIENIGRNIAIRKMREAQGKRKLTLEESMELVSKIEEIENKFSYKNNE